MNNVYYESELNRKDFMIQQLRQKNQDYSDIIQNLEKENSDLKSSLIMFKQEKNNTQLDRSDFYEKELKRLTDELIGKDKAWEEKMTEQQKKFEKDINNLRKLYESISNKADVATANERLCEKQKNQIEILNKEIAIINHINQTEKSNLQLTHELKFSDLKKKMLDQIKETQKKITQLNLENMDVSTKLILLQNHQLLIELEYQGMQIEELLKKKSALEKKVFELEKDLETHEHVENTLALKNKQMAEMIKRYNMNQSVSTPVNRFSFNDSDRDHNMLLSKSSDKRKIISGNIHYENLKLNYDKLIHKFQIYEKKYLSIFKLFESGLQRLVEDSGIKNMKMVNFDLDSIRNGDFSNFTDEQKYSILMILVEKLLPLLELSKSEPLGFGIGVKKNKKDAKFELDSNNILFDIRLEENLKFIENLPKIRTQTTFNKKIMGIYK